MKSFEITAKGAGWWVAIAVCAVLVACNGDDTSGGPPPGMGNGDQEVEVTVETTSVERGEFRVSGDYAGEIRSDGMTEISPEVAGRLTEVYANIGEEVSQGDVLAEVDDTSIRQSVRELEAGVSVAEANLEEARVNLENLRSDRQRKAPLVDRDMVSEREIEELDNTIRGTEQQVHVAEARLEETRARLETARQDLRNTDIRAPFDGKIAMRHVDRGTYVGPERAVYTLVDDGDLYISVQVPERQAPNVDTDTPATIRVGALGGLEVDGDIHRISPSIDSTTRSLRVDVVVDQPDEVILRPGMFARVNLQLGYDDDALTVDNQVLQRTIDGTLYLWQVVDGEARRVEFSSVGLQGRQRTQIIEQLEEGDQVVLRGQNNLEEGAKIRELDVADIDDESQAMPQAPEEL